MYRVLSEIITYKLVSAPSSGEKSGEDHQQWIERRMNMYRVLSEIITYKLVSVLLFQTRHGTYSSFSLSIVDGPHQTFPTRGS